MTRSNVADITRRSPTYESRLIKYALWGFEVHVPGLRRSRIDPNVSKAVLDYIFMSVTAIQQVYVLRLTDTLGLGRLLALERIHRDFSGDLAQYQTLRASYFSRPGNVFEGIFAKDYEPMARPIPWNWHHDEAMTATLIAEQVNLALDRVLPSC
jgi:hypothetical protein